MECGGHRMEDVNLPKTPTSLLIKVVVLQEETDGGMNMMSTCVPR